jgi:hypothetical protein
VNKITNDRLSNSKLLIFNRNLVSTKGTNILNLSNTGVTAGIYIKITVNIKGKITFNGMTLVESNIPKLTQV